MEAILLQLAIPGRYSTTDGAFEVQKRDAHDTVERLDGGLDGSEIAVIIVPAVVGAVWFILFFLWFRRFMNSRNTPITPKKWAKNIWLKMRYGDPSPLTVRSVPASNNAQPTPATDAVRTPPQDNNDSFEEVALTPPSKVHTAQAIPMSPVKRAESQTNPIPSSTGEQVQGPPFLTLRTVELSPRTKKAAPDSTS